MKKLLVTAAAIGLIAVPSIALANRGNDNNQSSATTANKAIQNNAAKNAAENEQENEPANQPANNQTNKEANDNDDATTTPAQGSTTAISDAQARTIAQNQMVGKTITKVEKETEEGKTVFSIKFSDGSRVDIDASNGTVVRKENRTDKNNDHSGPGRSGNQKDDSNHGSGNSDD